LAVIAVVAVLLGLHPVVQKAREVSARSPSANNLKQLGLSFRNHSDTKALRPPERLQPAPTASAPPDVYQSTYQFAYVEGVGFASSRPCKGYRYNYAARSTSTRTYTYAYTGKTFPVRPPVRYRKAVVVEGLGSGPLPVLVGAEPIKGAAPGVSAITTWAAAISSNQDDGFRNDW
jgi:hypothetical protein